MKTRSALLASIVRLAVFASVASGQEVAWTSHGPNDVGAVNDLSVASSAAYAATPNGVFRSTDGGGSWQATGLTGHLVVQVSARPGTATVVALLNGVWPSSNLYVSGDSGQTWTSVAGQDSITVVGIDPERPSNVYASSANDGSIWKSTDAGASWQQISTLPGNATARALTLDSRAICVLTPGALYKSVDGAIHWTSVETPLGSPGSIAAGSSAGVVYASVAGAVCRSADAATTWTCSSSFTSSSIDHVLEVPGAPAGPVVLASSAGGVFVSRDGGATWTRVEGDLGSASSPALASDLTGSLVLSGTDAQIFRSLDRGDRWTASSSGLKAVKIEALALDPSDPVTVWAGGLGNYGSGPGLFESLDAGLSWSSAGGPQGPKGVNALVIDRDHPQTMYAGWNGVFRTDDRGQTWTHSSPDPNAGLNVLAIDPAFPQRVWAGSGPGLLRSDDGARTWAPATIAQSVYCLLFDGRHPETIYAGSYWDVDYTYAEAFGGSIWVSHDHGTTFTKGAELPDPVISMARDTFQDRVLYAGTGFSGAFRSEDAGATWEMASEGLANPGAGAGLINAGPVSSLVADPVRPDYVYAATPYGVFRSTDGARTWQSFSNGLSPLTTDTLVISPDGTKLHAGTNGGGVFELDLAAADRSSPCLPNASRLCLVGSRYAVDLIATRPGGGRWMPGAARSLGDRAGYFSLPFATGDADLPEVVVKMLAEGAIGSSDAPVFYSSLTTLPYFLTVTDTLTGVRRSYASNPDGPLCGGADIPREPAANALSPRRASASGTAELSLIGGRFSVTLEARLPGSADAVHGVVMASADRFGFFSLPDVTGDAQFPEIVVKMIDARTVDGAFWFFETNLTSLDYTLTVLDHATGRKGVWAANRPFCGAFDTSLFNDSPWDYVDFAPPR